MKESQAKKHSVLVLDGDHKNTLAIVRHLGRTKQYEIDVVFSKKMSLCFFQNMYLKSTLSAIQSKIRPDMLMILLKSLNGSSTLL